jgi:glycine/serine hydroxymethyltransferase
MKQVASWIKDVIESKGNETKLSQIKNYVKELCVKFPVYPHHA